MKKFRIPLIVIVSLIVLYAAFIIEESIRLYNDLNAVPLIIIDAYEQETSASSSEIKYVSLGFTLHYEYNDSIDSRSLEGTEQKRASSGGFILFGRFLIWAWIV